jgi:hypothetical protein
MKPCECCGNTYDKAFEITVGGETHTFDSFACAIQSLAPHCSHCGVTIIGHGMETGNAFYCCAHCARAAGISEMQDRVA